MTISLEAVLQNLQQRSQPAPHQCDQCRATYTNHSFWLHPDLDAWLCTPCHNKLIQRQQAYPDLPAWITQHNAIHPFGDTDKLEWWLLRLTSPTPLTHDQLITITCCLGLTWWSDAAEGAVYRNCPYFRQRGHRLLVKQPFGLNV